MKNIFRGSRRRLTNKALPWVLKNKFSVDGLNVAASRNVVMFPKLNVAFNRVKKNANSTTVSLLYAMEEGRFAGPWQAKHHSKYLQKASLPLLMSADRFFYFVIVRDPYSRTLSAFLNKFSKPSYVDRFGSFDLTPDGFHQFLIWLSNSGLESDAHWDFQKKLIMGPLETFDAVLRFENFPNCFENFVRDRDLVMPAAAEKILAGAHQGTRTDASRMLEQFYSKDCIEIVSSLYQEDFDFLDYPADFKALRSGQSHVTERVI